MQIKWRKMRHAMRANKTNAEGEAAGAAELWRSAVKLKTTKTKQNKSKTKFPTQFLLEAH